ncbi:MAG: glycine cleavage system protein GcvH [Actinobacteria bacterium]|nr:glycine cleavage system protein GcvH [Actinomycetota bacterium]MCB9388610.1 glycine cleavage system protein GcvH [Acidimicrobiia bacterium]
MNLPDGLAYTEDHEWITKASPCRVGITDYAQDQLGDVVYVELPAIGQEVDAGGFVCEIESTKSVSEIFAPVAGVIAAINLAVVDYPDKINSDPYGEGWLFEITPTNAADVDALMSAAQYATHTGS